MSKIKLSFSLIIAIFLVGILSTAAFAKDPYGLKPVQKPNFVLNVPFNGNTADTADYDSTAKTYNAVSFDVVLKDGSTVLDTQTATISTSTGKASVNFQGGIKDANGNLPAGAKFEVGKSYMVYLYKTSDTGRITLLSKSTALVTDAHNSDMYKAGIDVNGNPIDSATVDVDGSGKNANQTGFNNTRKQRTGQKVHGFYQNNTNSCASCHQTHTGSDDMLLFKDGVYSTCSACHDGTTGAYNSFAPVSEENAHSISGTFNVQTTNHNGSLHEADGSLKVAAAPGGNTDLSSKQFGQEFDCASCHSPHGNGSASENNLNLDPLGWGSVAYSTATNDGKYGKLFTLTTIYTEDAAKARTTMDTPYILVKHTVTADEIGTDTTKTNYFFKRQAVKDTNLTAGTDVIMTYRWNGSKKYVPDYSLWLREKGYPYKADTKLLKVVDVNGTPTDTEVTNLTVVWKDGFAYGPGLAEVTKAKVSLGIDVETTDEIASLYDSKDAAYIPQSGVEMSKYCASCHTDYLSATRIDNTGVYTQAHRHQTATDELTCVRCHFGHGSEAQIMKDANDQTYYDLTKAGAKFDASVTGNAQKAIDYLLDPNPSSAIKRYTGMSVCYACHGQGEQFLGNPNNIDRPLSGKPGEENRTAVTPQ